MDSCKWCRQTLIVPGYCSCRNYRVWTLNDKETEAKTITALNHGVAASTYASLYLKDPEDGEEWELMVKNASGELKRVNVAACVSIDWDYRIEESEDERTG